MRSGALPQMDPETLRRQAARFRGLAAELTDEMLRDSVAVLAEKYEAEAKRIETGE
jgi:hypothetical protein